MGGVNIGNDEDSDYLSIDSDGTISDVGGSVVVNDGLDVWGDALFTGTATTTNQARMIDFTGFDKEGTTDFSDRAYIQHTINTGGLAGSVLLLSSMNDATDGIAFATHADSDLMHNNNIIWDAGNDGIGSGLNADLLDGYQPSVAAAGNTIVQRHASGYIFANYFNTAPNDVTSGVTKVLVETGNDGYMRHGTQAALRTFIGAGSGNGLDADTVDSLHAASFYLATNPSGYISSLTGAILDYTPGNWEMASNSLDDIYSSATLELREYNHAGAQTGAYTEAPSIGFHWGGRIASQIMMGTSGDIEIRDNPGTGYETLRARDYKVGATAIIDGSRNIVNAGSGAFSGALTASSFSGAGTGLTGTAASLTAGNANKLINKNWYWSGQGGQPTWLWGGSDGTNMYVYNPSNFNVNYATSAGNADTVDGYHYTAFVPSDGYRAPFGSHNSGGGTGIDTRQSNSV